MRTPLHVGLIGVGRWGKIYLKTLLSLGDRCRITHLGTSNPENARLLAYPVEVLADRRQVVRSDCDVVIIATPPETHAAMLELCLEHGKPCIVEKPLCLDVETADRLHHLAMASQVPVLVDHTHLFHPSYADLKKALGQDRTSIHTIISEGMALGPFQTPVPALWDWGPHDISLCLDLLGQIPDHVAAFGGPADPEGHPELMSIRLAFPSGACGWVSVGRLSPKKRRRLTVYTATHAYVLDELAADPLSVASFDFAQRLTNPPQTPLTFHLISPTTSLRPMANMVTYFLDGLAGGDRRYFGTELARDVVRVLAKCDALLKAEAPVVER